MRMNKIFSKKQNERFEAFLDEMSDSNIYESDRKNGVRPNKLIPISVYWTKDKNGNSVLSEEYMLHLFRRELQNYKKTFEKEKEIA